MINLTITCKIKNETENDEIIFISKNCIPKISPKNEYFIRLSKKDKESLLQETSDIIRNIRSEYLQSIFNSDIDSTLSVIKPKEILCVAYYKYQPETDLKTFFEEISAHHTVRKKSDRLKGAIEISPLIYAVNIKCPN